MAVYTDVADEDLRQFLMGYDLGDLISFAGIAEGVENSNFLLRTDRDGVTTNYILTLYEKRVDPNDLPYFVGLMDHLAARGISCPVPVHGRDGQALRQLNGRPAALVSFLDGVWPRRIETGHCAEVGRALAGLHLAAATYSGRRKNALALSGWVRLVEATATEADLVKPGLADLIVSEVTHLAGKWPFALPVGTIHADLFPDNVFFRGQQLSGLIDFYFACTDALAYDLAICINAWCFEADGQLNLTKSQALIGAYDAIRPLTDDERTHFVTLTRGAALRFLLTRLYDWQNQSPGALVKPKDPLDYEKRLRQHRQIDSIAGYGV